MAFRRTENRADQWRTLVEVHADLLAALPHEACVNEAAFRDYVTSGEHRGVRFTPAVDELSKQELAALAEFIHHRAQFDMDASCFDAFNQAFQHSLRS